MQFFSGIGLEEIGIRVLAVILAVAFHEYAHGRMAFFLGDPTPKEEGRLTLNPLSHLDFLGTLLLFFTGFGWAKPVAVNPANFRGNPQRGMVLVAVAGPLVNFFLAYLAGIGFNLAAGSPYLMAFFRYFLYLNVALAVFNLLPVPPLDGFRILSGFTPSSRFLREAESYSSLLLILLVVTGLAGHVIEPLVSFISFFIQVASNLNFLG